MNSLYVTIIGIVVSAFFAGVTLLFRRYRNTLTENSELVAENKKVKDENEVLSAQIQMLTDRSDDDADYQL